VRKVVMRNKEFLCCVVKIFGVRRVLFTDVVRYLRNCIIRHGIIKGLHVFAKALVALWVSRRYAEYIINRGGE